MCVSWMRSRRVLSSLVCGLAGVLFVYAIAPSPAYPISGFVLPTHPTAQVVPANQVKLFSSNQLPSSMVSSRGHVSLVWHSPKQSMERERRLVNAAKAAASASGANAIVVDVLGHTAQGVPGQWASYRFQGEAVYVPQLELLRSKGGES